MRLTRSNLACGELDEGKGALAADTVRVRYVLQTITQQSRAEQNRTEQSDDGDNNNNSGAGWRKAAPALGVEATEQRV